MSEDNGFLIFCASLAGAFLMLGTMCLQYGLAYAGMAVCLPYLIAVSISVGEGSYPPENEIVQPVLGIMHLPASRRVARQDVQAFWGVLGLMPWRSSALMLAHKIPVSTITIIHCSLASASVAAVLAHQTAIGMSL